MPNIDIPPRLHHNAPPLEPTHMKPAKPA